MSSYIMKSYDQLLDYILNYGEYRQNRKGEEEYITYSVFGYMLKFDISQRFPILTKRKMWPKAIWGEMIWMLSGSTDINELEKLGSNIWSPWRSKEFEQKHNYKDGEIGPSYGWSFRHFGGNYARRYVKRLFKSLDWQNHRVNIGGFDQIRYVIDELRKTPHSRRAVISLWDGSQLDKVILPYCHCLFNLNIQHNGLSGALYIRSSDVPIGLPANIQFYASLLYMIAQQINQPPNKLVVFLGDAHIYENQISAVQEYLYREEGKSPVLRLTPEKSMEKYQLDNFVLEEYTPQDKIYIPVVV